MIRRGLAIVALLAIAPATHPAAQPSRPRPAALGPASATARYFAGIRANPPLLLAFLAEMPKGGDLHAHISGSIYAESFLQWAAADNLCVATATMTIVAGACDAAAGRPAASALLQDGALVSRAIDAMSMRNWDRSVSGHDHFFGAFDKFGPHDSRFGDMLAEITARAAAERVSYIEVMVSTDGGLSAQKGIDAGRDDELARLRDRLLAASFGDVVTAAKKRLDDAEARQRELLRCGTPRAEPGCGVTVRFVSQVLRNAAPAAVFAQMLGGFEVVSHDPRVVALNLVAPEDGVVAMRDFSLHMRMLDYLHGVYPAVPLTLHAGELVDRLVPPEALRFHIRDSVRIGHAQRIGHGVDVMYEDEPIALLQELAAKRVLVEVGLTSNDLILGVAGVRHPLRTYLQYGVPLALVSDDAGVARSSMTFEFRKAVEEHGLDYDTLKTMVRNSIAFSFADAATKQTLQADLETAFRRFESKRRQS
jgi:adenosine deaminase